MRINRWQDPEYLAFIVGAGAILTLLFYLFKGIAWLLTNASFVSFF